MVRAARWMGFAPVYTDRIIIVRPLNMMDKFGSKKYEYNVQFKPRAAKDIARLSSRMQLEIIKDIEAMSDGLTGDVKRLTNFTPCLMVFVGKNILTNEKTDCHFLSLKTVREDTNFYT